MTTSQEDTMHDGPSQDPRQHQAHRSQGVSANISVSQLRASAVTAKNPEPLSVALNKLDQLHGGGMELLGFAEDILSKLDPTQPNDASNEPFGPTDGLVEGIHMGIQRAGRTQERLRNVLERINSAIG